MRWHSVENGFDLWAKDLPGDCLGLHHLMWGLEKTYHGEKIVRMGPAFR